VNHTSVSNHNIFETEVTEGNKYCDMSDCCWAMGGGTSYHEDRLWINSRLLGCATVEARLCNSKESGVSSCHA
jgi:hypothetical protein